MRFRSATQVLILLAMLFCGAQVTSAVCTSMSVSVQTASGGATVSGSLGVYSLSMGAVNGLGIGTPSMGVTVTTSAGGATYTTPIHVNTTLVACLGNTTQTVKVYQSSTTSTSSQTAAREGGTAASVTTVANSQAAATTISTTSLTNLTLTRYVGLFISNANGSGAVSGSLAPKIIYEVLVN